jgi:hypothetical protein
VIASQIVAGLCEAGVFTQNPGVTDPGYNFWCQPERLTYAHRSNGIRYEFGVAGFTSNVSGVVL